MTQMKQALEGVITPEMQKVAQTEGLSEEYIAEGLSMGNVVIPANKERNNLKPVGIGQGLSTKVNANIGTSQKKSDSRLEIEKASTAVAAGADTLMDLSTGQDMDYIRKELLKNIELPLGTVPVYQAALKAWHEHDALVEMTAEDIFKAVEQHAGEGVDFVTVHCGVNLEAAERLKKSNRIVDIASRGGSFHLAWILHHEQENPLYADYDRLLEIALKYDVTLSLGDGFRPGSVVDATDRPQIQELVVLGELVKRARDAGVQVMVEGPGHVPIHQVEANIMMQKRICDNAPFYVLGPLVTDVAAGYDHIAAAIGGAVAASAGADFLCYVTPAEHLSLPDIQDVWWGVTASRIAAHAGDIGKGLPGALDRDEQMSRARKELNWEKMQNFALDSEGVALFKKREELSSGEACSMCGDYCAMKIIKDYLKR